MALVRFPKPILRAVFHGRRKRFFADLTLSTGERIVAHCANTGSMRSCLLPGAPALVWDANDPKRKTRYSWKAIQIDGGWVGIDTSIPNHLVAAAIEAGEIPLLRGYHTLDREKPMGENSRVDILLTSPRRRCWVEVKNVTLVEDSIARFPDSVTTRGQKHLRELIAHVREGDRAAMVYLVQRSDARWFRPADDIDPEYGRLVREAKREGVDLIALSAKVGVKGVWTTGSIPVRLPKV